MMGSPETRCVQLEPRDNLLEVRGINKAYPGVKALHNVHFDLRPGEVHALVGENGAGKSTLVKILSGVINEDSGQIRIRGEEMTIKGPRHARSLGLASIFQELSQISTLTVAENVFLAHEATRHGLLLDRMTMAKRTNAILAEYGIDLDANALLSTLSPAQRQLAEIVKAISQRPQILIMDEPTSSLTEAEARIVFRIIEYFKKQGTGVIYVSHRMDEIIQIADRMTILRDGHLVHQGSMKELDLGQIVKFMVGRDVELYQPEPKPASGAKILNPKLKVVNLTREGAFTDVSFDLYPGEILGIAGLVGSGRSELVRTIFGVDRCDSGEMRIDGTAVKISSVEDAMALGIALLPESRHLEGLVLKQSIAQNLALPILKKLSIAGWVDSKKLNRMAREKIRQLDIKPGESTRIVNDLSGGNQQKVMMAKWLLTEPQILIVDEPTVGVDVPTKSEIHRLIKRLARSGVAVIMISSELPELLAHSDRIMIMNRGRVLGIFGDVTQEMIMSLIMEDMMMNKKTQKAVRNG